MSNKMVISLNNRMSWTRRLSTAGGIIHNLQEFKVQTIYLPKFLPKHLFKMIMSCHISLVLSDLKLITISSGRDQRSLIALTLLTRHQVATIELYLISSCFMESDLRVRLHQTMTLLKSAWMVISTKPQGFFLKQELTFIKEK